MEHLWYHHCVGNCQHDCFQTACQTGKKTPRVYSKRATWGTTIGSIIGLLLVYGATSSDSKALLITMLIVGFVVLPFVLAFLLELTNRQGALMALKCATSATCAYLSDTLLKLAVFVYAIYVIFQIG